MKKVIVFALALVLAGGVAYANFCARDIVPASTLLVPWGVVSLDATNVPDPNGWTTLFAVTNVSADAVLVHFTLWDIKSNHVVDWDEVLTGFDVWTMNFRDLLNGRFDMFDTGSSLAPGLIAAPPYGPTSNAGFATPMPAPTDVSGVDPTNCNFPYGNRSVLSTTIISKLQLAMYAQPTQTVVGCKAGVLDFASPPWLVSFKNNPVWFYLTADTVRNCNNAFPDESQYWSPSKFPIVKNVLIGDIIYLNAFANYSDSVPAVHIEADAAAANPNLMAFYDRYSGGGPIAAAPNVEDDREPLATAFAFRFMNDGGVKTNAMVWKGAFSSATDRTGLEVGSSSSKPVNACRPYVYYAWDENEHALARGGGGPSGFDTAEPNAFPWESQQVPINQANFNGLKANNGWMLLVFNPSLVGATSYYYQAWVGVQYVLPGAPANYSTALEAATMANYWCFPTQQVPQLGVNFNYNDALMHAQAWW